MFQLGTIEPRLTGVASNGFLRRKTGQARFCRFAGLEQATRACSILMAFVDCEFPRDSLAAQGFSVEQIDDILSNFVEHTETEEKGLKPKRYRRCGFEPGKTYTVLRDPKPVYRVLGLQVTVALVQYIREPIDRHAYYEDDFGIMESPDDVKANAEEKVETPDSFDNFKDRSVHFISRPFYFQSPWPADTRWSILMPSQEFFPHIDWEIRHMMETGSWSQHSERAIEKHSNNKQSYFDSSAYIYYP